LGGRPRFLLVGVILGADFFFAPVFEPQGARFFLVIFFAPVFEPQGARFFLVIFFEPVFEPQGARFFFTAAGGRPSFFLLLALPVAAVFFRLILLLS